MSLLRSEATAVQAEAVEDDEAVEVVAADSVAPTSDLEVEVAPETVVAADTEAASAATAVDMEVDTEEEEEVLALAPRAGGRPFFVSLPSASVLLFSLSLSPGSIIYRLCSSTFWRLHGRNSLCTNN